MDFILYPGSSRNRRSRRLFHFAKQHVPILALAIGCPAAIKITRVLFVDLRRDDAGHGIVELLRLHGKLIVVWVAPRDGSAACFGRVAPVLRVILLGHSSGTGITEIVMTQKILDLRWRI